MYPLFHPPDSLLDPGYNILNSNLDFGKFVYDYKNPIALSLSKRDSRRSSFDKPLSHGAKRSGITANGESCRSPVIILKSERVALWCECRLLGSIFLSAVTAEKGPDPINRIGRFGTCLLIAMKPYRM
jgi:hypothetical protein